NVIDRVETTSAIWLGLTSGCARCHDHKYDPITQKDFYRLFAFFNNVPESGSGEERPINHPPTMKAPTSEQEAQMNGYGAEIRSLQTWMGEEAAKNLPKSEKWQPANPLPEVKEGLLLRSAFGHDGTRAEGEVKFEPGRATGAVTPSDKGSLD